MRTMILKKYNLSSLAMPKKNNLEYSSNIYRNGLDILSKYMPIYDIIFIDIEVPYVNGLKGAEKIRELDSVVILVFITNLKQYALKGYEVDAMDFLVKPISYTAFSTMMSRIMKRINTVFTYRCTDILWNKKPIKLVLSNLMGLFHVLIFNLFIIEHCLCYPQ